MARRPKKPIAFEADAALIDRLGSELVAKQETALVELIKNSFDADATTVKLSPGHSRACGNRSSTASQIPYGVGNG
ncbi:MAG TPA: ATP-binding protein [Thermoanaerobaculia bacterium]|nr:ATP-binding protein [Thermoanaerobaculia bacterium]